MAPLPQAPGETRMRHTCRVAGSIERGRDAFLGRAWASAYDLLAAAADRGVLCPEDLERLAVAAYLVGKDDESTLAWERAHLECLRLDDPDEAARCAFWLGLALLLRGEEAHAGGWLARAARLVEDGGHDYVARGYLLIPAALQSLSEGDAETAYSLSGEAADIAGRLGDSDLLAFAWLGQGQASIVLGEMARGVALLDEVMVAVTTGEVSPVPAGIIYCAVIEACLEIYDVRRAAEWIGALSRWCESQPDLVPYRGQCLVHRAQILQAHGEWADAVAEAQRALECLSQPPHPAVGEAYYQQAELHRLRGHFDEAEQGYRQASQHGREPTPGLALLRLAEGHVDAATASIRRVLDHSQPLARPTMLVACVEIMLAAGDTDAARAASDELQTFATAIDAPLLRAMAAQAAGSVLIAEGDAAGALAALRHALAGWRDLAMPYDAARTRVLLGLACRGVGDHDSSTLELDAARSAFDRLGAGPDVARVKELADVSCRRTASVLTARECEVLLLLAAGRTNREIGSRLVISEHTVARHVQNIFTKLGVSSRAAATAYAYQHDLV